LYKAVTIESGVDKQLEDALNCINRDHGVIISTSATEHRVYVFYEVPEVS
jgi:hypothetical protein